MRPSDRQVSGQAGLPGEDRTILHMRRSGDPDLRHDQTQRADAHVMPHVHEVVDLRARPDHRVIDAAAIDRGVCPDLDIIADYAAAYVRNLLVRAIAEHIAEAVAANASARMNQHPPPDSRSRVDAHAREQARVVADLHAVAHAQPASIVTRSPRVAPAADTTGASDTSRPIVEPGRLPPFRARPDSAPARVQLRRTRSMAS